MAFLCTFSVQLTKFWTQPRPTLWKLSRISMYSTLSHKIPDVIGCYLTNYWMSYVNVIVGYITNLICLCVLSYILLGIIVCYLKLLDFIVCYLTNCWAFCTLSHKIVGAIACYLTNCWMSLLQTIGHHCMLSHKQLDVIACYLTNCWISYFISRTAECYCRWSNELLNFCTFCSVPLCLLGSKGEYSAMWTREVGEETCSH
jgi:hypothetical protein